VVAILVEEIDDSEAGKWPETLRLDSPRELAEWADQNHELVADVLNALKSSYATELNEEQIWHIVATASGDPQWLEAHQTMQEAEQTWKDLNHPENAPLGAIGLALDSDQTVGAHERYLFMLANFAIISEGLMERRPDLAQLLNVLLVQKRMIDQSLSRARQVLEAAKNLADMFSLKETFTRAARGPSFIRRQFRASMRLLAPKKQFNTMSVIVPWSPET
jgi:hypothetical protein